MDNFDINSLMQDKDMAELFGKVKNMVDSGNIPDEMKDMVSALKGKQEQNSTGEEQKKENSDFQFDIKTVSKIKSMMDKMSKNKDDPRANLLLSLKPYLKETRKEKVDQYVKMLNMSKVMEMFNDTGGETKK